MNIPVTGITIVDLALALLANHAYLISFGVAALENVFIVGAVVPGETTIMAAGFVASVSTADTIFAAAVFVAAVIGSMIGSNISYAIGYRGGRPVLERYGHRFSMGERRLKDAEAYFECHGSKTIVLGRFAPGIKGFVPVLAGVSRMNLAVFEVYTLIGAAAYTGIMVTLGYFFGSNFSLLLRVVQRMGWAALVIAVLLVGAWVWERRRLILRRQERELECEPDEAGHGADVGSE